MRRPPDGPVPRDAHPDDRSRANRGQTGDTLIELLIAIVLIATAGLSILTAFSTAIWGSVDYRTIATADTVLRTAAGEAISQL